MKTTKNWTMAMIVLAIITAGIIGSDYAVAENTTNSTLNETLNENNTANISDSENEVSDSGSIVKDELKTAHAWVLYKYALIPAEKHKIGMNAIINYANNMSWNTTKLIELNTTFGLQQDALKSAAEHVNYAEGKAIISQMKNTISEFRIETKRIAGNNTQSVKDAVDRALEANEAYLDSLVVEARNAKKNHNIEAFDSENKKIGAQIGKANEKGANVSELHEKLNEIKEKRSELLKAMEEGVESCKGEGLGKCNITESQRYLALKEELKSDYEELREIAKMTGQRQKISNEIKNAQKMIESNNKKLENAEKKGRDVVVEKAKLNEIKGMLENADRKYVSSDYDGANEDMDSAKNAMRTLKESASGKNNK